jgi:parallel beta-helix repeat protein
MILAGCGSAPDATSQGNPAQAAPATPRTLTVDAQGPADFKTIVEAVRDAKAGDTIKIKPGSYVRPLLTIDRPITIIGDGKAEQITIEGSANWNTGAEVKIANLTISGKSSATAVHCLAGKLTIEDCVITNPLGIGLSCEKVGEVKMTRCVIRKCIHGIAGPGKIFAEKNEIAECETGIIASCPDYVLKSNKIHDSTKDGIFVARANAAAPSKPTIEDNEIYANSWAGVDVTDTTSAPTVSNNRIHDNEGAGIYVHAGAAGNYEKNEIYNQKTNCGIGMEGAVEAILKGNKIHDNHMGVHADVKSTATVQDNEIWKSETAGVRTDAGSDLKINGNKIHDNEKNGCSIHAKGTLEDNDIYANGFPGIFVGKGATATIRRNKIHDHSVNRAVWLEEAGSVICEENEITKNRAGAVNILAGSMPIFRKNRITNNDDFAFNISDKSGGTFEDNDLRGNQFGGWFIDVDSRPKVTRARNTLDDTADARAKTGDWVDYRIVPGGKAADIKVRKIVTARTENDVTFDMTQLAGDKQQKSTFVGQTGATRSFLSGFLASIQTNHELKIGDSGRETLDMAGKQIPCTWTRYEITLLKENDTKAGVIKMKVWTGEGLRFDDTVKAVIEVPGQPKGDFELLAYGDAQSPPPPFENAPKTEIRSKGPPPPAIPPAQQKQAAESTTPKPAPPSTPPVDDKKAKARTTTYVLKDGRRLTATSAVDAGEEITVKTDAGKFETIKKDDIKETIRD